MTWKWIIMVWLTQNPASAWHAASADQSNAAWPVAYKIQQYYKNNYSIPRNNRVYWQQSCPGEAAAGGCPSAPCLGARPLPLPAPASIASTAPTSVNSLCCWHLPKHTGKSDSLVKARRRLGKAQQLKTLESKPEALVKDQSKCGNLKLQS